MSRITIAQVALAAVSTLAGLTCMAEPTASAAQRAFPLTVLECRGGLSRVSIDEHGIIEYERSSDRGDRLYAKVSSADLAELRTIIESDEYKRLIEATNDHRRLVVCGVSPFVRIEHYGKIVEFEIVDGRLSPDLVARLVRLVEQIQAARFPEEHEAEP